jgi:hypothetical protein
MTCTVLAASRAGLQCPYTDQCDLVMLTVILGKYILLQNLGVSVRRRNKMIQNNAIVSYP